jgi:putative acetyltransferase
VVKGFTQKLRALNRATLSNVFDAARQSDSEWMKSPFEIRLDSPVSARVVDLLQEHYQEMFKHSPAESVHALDISSLNTSDVTFWSAWDDANLAGCAALKQIDVACTELKSMKTASAYLRQGVAAHLLSHLISESSSRGYQTIYLETGSADVFTPARKLYTSFGFHEVGPFSDYELDPHSVFMSLNLLSG